MQTFHIYTGMATLILRLIFLHLLIYSKIEMAYKISPKKIVCGKPEPNKQTNEKTISETAKIGLSLRLVTVLKKVDEKRIKLWPKEKTHNGRTPF